MLWDVSVGQSISDSTGLPVRLLPCINSKTAVQNEVLESSQSLQIEMYVGDR